MTQWNFATVWDGIAAVDPTRDAVVYGERHESWGELRDRAHRFAQHLRATGLVPGDKVALAMANRPEFVECFYGALVHGCVPVNVNYRYTSDEIHHVVDDSDAKIVVHTADLTKPVRKAAKRIGKRWRPALLEIGDAYEAALAAAPDPPAHPRLPEGDDLIFLYTGGTTGSPKGVMWPNDDLYRSFWVSAHPDRPEPPDPIAAVAAGKRAGTRLTAAPLIHGTGLITSLSTWSGGGCVVLLDDDSFDAARVWSAVEREQVMTMTIVGDAFARPLLDALEHEPDRWDLTSLRHINSSGVTFSPDTKQGLLRHLPQLTIVDTLGASEGMGPSNRSRAGEGEIRPARFRVSSRVRVVDEHTGRDVTPGSDEVGLLAIGPPIPLGYYNDPYKTAQTFKMIGGTRYAVAGDYASVDDDGSVRLLGRGSASVNTGGEKVYPEEIELALKKHKSVFDCVVVGVPDPRFGEAVVAIIQVTENHYLDEAELQAWCRSKLAGFKTPRRFLLVDHLPRTAAGKAEHPKLRAWAMAQLGIAEPES